MKENNKKLLILVGVLLLVGGISFAYFAGKTLFGGTGANVSATTAVINGATLSVEGNLEFNDLNILPGHETVSYLKLTATGNDETVLYNLIWNGTNSLNTPLNYKVYKSETKKDVTATCERKTKVVSGAQILNEECTISNLDSLGEAIATGVINTSTETTKEILVSNEYIEATSSSKEVYYYVILEYPNLDKSQNEDLNGSFNGTVTVEGSNTKADINIVKVYTEQNDGSYKETTSIPKKEELLVFNSEKSSCTNSATPNWNADKWSLKVNNLTTSGTDCNLYFKKGAGANILANATVKESPDGFTGVATGNEGVFKTEDDDGETYYWRGSVTNNYVNFAGYYWRIIRINGDGTIRLIYQGTAATSTGTETQIGTSAFNTSYNDNMYVGFKYTSNEVHGTGTESTILGTLNTWYETNIDKKGYSGKVDQNAGFCNDRYPSTTMGTSNGSGGTSTTTTYYGAFIRMLNSSGSWNTTQKPTFKCKDSRDLFTKSGATKKDGTTANGNRSLKYPVGLLTADEVVYAGGFGGTANSSYYLYTGQVYWTLSPSNYSGSYARVFRVYSNGNLNGDWVHSTRGVRPVINLKADTKFTYKSETTKGTASDPYVVS